MAEMSDMDSIIRVRSGKAVVKPMVMVRFIARGSFRSGSFISSAMWITASVALKAYIEFVTPRSHAGPIPHPLLPGPGLVMVDSG